MDAPTTAWKMLTDGVNSDKYPTRSDAIAALAILETDRRAVRLMIKALEDKNPIIRVQAAASLGDIKARAAIPTLRVALDDKEPQVSFAAAQALWNMGDRSGREDFLEILSGERKTQPGIIESNIAKAKAEMHDPKGLVLIGINSASQAMLGPGSLGVSAVEELATNKTAPVEALCAKLLGDDDNPDSVGELKEALGDKNWTVRAAAAHSLANMNHPEAIPLLQNMMMNDKKEAARFAAAAAIIRLDERQRGRLDRRAAAPATSASPTPAAQPAH
jgi:HEAT repeat protein